MNQDPELEAKIIQARQEEDEACALLADAATRLKEASRRRSLLEARRSARRALGASLADEGVRLETIPLEVDLTDFMRFDPYAS